MFPLRPESGKLSAEEKLNLLVEFGARISCELRLDKLLDIIGQQITKMLDVGRCTIYLKDVEKNELWSKIAQGRGLEHTEIRVPLSGSGVISLVARTGDCGLVLGQGHCGKNADDRDDDKKFNKGEAA